jgi:transaldolase
MTRAAETAYKSPLHKMTQTTPTCLWNDSASIEELAYSIENGAVGATCNPVIVVGILKKEMSFWRGRIQELIKELPTAIEDEIAWKLVREISIRAAALLKPIFDAQHGRNGRLSIQTDPRLFRDSQAIVKQALEFSQLAPNMVVKIPVTRAGIPAIEEATYRGVSINATVSFSLPQYRERGASVHADGGAPGRLAESGDGKRKYRDRSGISGMGRSGGA